MPVVVDTSTPALASNTSAGTATITSPSFTPVGGSLLLVTWAANSASASDVPAAPSITDSLGSHLTYTRAQFATPGSVGANVGGQAAIWTAPVPASPSGMTVSVTDNDTAGHAQSTLQVWVLTGVNTASPVSVSGVGVLSPAGTVVSQAYTAGVTGGMGFLAGCDWNNAVDTITPGAGCSVTFDAQSNVFNFFMHRTAGDDVAGSQNSLSGTLNVSDTALWAWADVAAQNYTAALGVGLTLSASPSGSAAGAAALPVGLSLSAGSVAEPVTVLAVGLSLPAVPNLWVYAGVFPVTYPQYLGVPGEGSLSVVPGEFVLLMGRASGYPWTLAVPPPDGRWVTLGTGGTSYGVPLERGEARRPAAPARSRPARHGDRSQSAYQAAGSRRIT